MMYNVVGIISAFEDDLVLASVFLLEFHIVLTLLLPIVTTGVAVSLMWAKFLRSLGDRD